MASAGLASSSPAPQVLAVDLAPGDAEHQALLAEDANHEQPSRPTAPAARDRLAWFFALDPATRCVFAASFSFAFLLLMSLQMIKLAVYFVALLPGFLMCRRALHVYRHDVTQESFARSMLAGLSFTVLVFLCELAAGVVLELLSFLALGYGSVSYVAITSLVEAFVIAAWFEEKTKAAITQRAILFENASCASSILAHSIAGATAFATLENVLYLSMSSPGRKSALTLGVLFVRTFICVPLHICWGITNGAAIAIAKLAPEANSRLGNGLVLRITAGPFSIPASRVSLIGPSVLLHGLWDFPLFMTHKSGAALKAYCVVTKQPPDQCWRNDFANSLNMELLVGVMMSLIFFVVIPVWSFFVCWRRVKLLRTIESADFNSVLRQVQTVPSANVRPPVLQRAPITMPASVSLWSRADVATWLSSAGLQQYQEAFKPVNGAVLLTLTDTDLQELGVSVAVHRRAVLQLVEEDGPQVIPSQVIPSSRLLDDFYFRQTIEDTAMAEVDNGTTIPSGSGSQV